VTTIQFFAARHLQNFCHKWYIRPTSTFWY